MARYVPQRKKNGRRLNAYGRVIPTKRITNLPAATHSNPMPTRPANFPPATAAGKVPKRRLRQQHLRAEVT